MPVPDFQSMLLPVLRITADGKEHTTADLRGRVASELNLTPEDLAEKLPSGSQTAFANRLSWSAVYLNHAGALDRTKRGVFRITERGRNLLEKNLPKITVQTLNQFPEFVAFHKGSANGTADDRQATATKAETPEEELANAYKILRDNLATDVLEAVKKSSSLFFEELVVDLLVAMGYGGSIEDAGKVVGRAGDEGIDGIIKEDKLGLDVVYIQAKRWKDVVGRPYIQAFAGSLEGARARKGIFLTTSHFSQDAIDYVQKIEKRIVLVDGKQLAEFMIDYDVGVTASQVFKVKRLDTDYFESA